MKPAQCSAVSAVHNIGRVALCEREPSLPVRTTNSLPHEKTYRANSWVGVLQGTGLLLRQKLRFEKIFWLVEFARFTLKGTHDASRECDICM